MCVPEGSPLPKGLFPEASKSVFFEIEALVKGEKASLKIKVESWQAKKTNQIVKYKLLAKLLVHLGGEGGRDGESKNEKQPDHSFVDRFSPLALLKNNIWKINSKT